MSAYDLYHTWNPRVRELLPHERVTRVHNVAWMIVGLHLGQSVHLSDIARKLPIDAKLNSTTDRFRRFMNNKAFRARRWYRPIAEYLLTRAAVCGTIRLIVDGTKVGAGHQLLMVAVASRQRALPIAWTWVRTARGLDNGVNLNLPFEWGGKRALRRARSRQRRHALGGSGACTRRPIRRNKTILARWQATCQVTP